MKKQISENTIYVTGAARFKDLIYLVGWDRGLEERDVIHSRFVGFSGGDFVHMGDRNWATLTACVAKHPTEKLIAVGEKGDVFTYVDGKAVDEVIGPKPVAIRGSGVVDGIAMACGMKRQVFKRIGENSWQAMHAPSPGSDENAGFEDLCGFSSNEIYAVGWNGEIWQWNGTQWGKRDSPTQMILRGACCGMDGQVYACGQQGTLIRGRNDTWEQIELGNVSEDFSDICWFKDRAYISSLTGVYTLMGDQWEPVDFGDDPPATYGRLTEAEGTLWSVGSADIFSFDGTHWMRVD